MSWLQFRLQNCWPDSQRSEALGFSKEFCLSVCLIDCVFCLDPASTASAVAAVSGPVSVHVDSSAGKQREASVSCSSAGSYHSDDDYDLCSEDFVKGELHSKLRGVLSQEEAEEATR